MTFPEELDKNEVVAAKFVFLLAGGSLLVKDF